MTANVSLGNAKQAETDIAAATTTNIGASSTAKVRITGSAVSISSFGSVANRLRFIRFAGAVTLVHSAALALPGAVNKTTAAGDFCTAISDNAGNWTVGAMGPAGTGDVVGPGSATADDIVVFNGTTGKLVKDGGTSIAVINAAIAAKGDVTGPAGAVADRIAVFNGTTGKIIKDGGALISALLALSGGTMTGPLTLAADPAAALQAATRQYVDSTAAAAAAATLGLSDVDSPRNFELGGAAYVDVQDIRRWPFFSTASAVTLTASHAGRAYLVTANATITLPAASACDDDWMVRLKARGGTITLAAAGADTIDGAASITITTGNRAIVLRTGATSFEVF